MASACFAPAAAVADVAIASGHDGLIVVPREAIHRQEVGEQLRRAAPSVRPRMTSIGFHVDPFEAGAVLAAEQALDLRWGPGARRYAENRVRAKAIHARVAAEIRSITAAGVEAARARLMGLEGLDILDGHQAINVAAMTVEHGCGLCIFDEQGTGKTVTLIFGFDALVEANEADFALIVAPKSMVPEWARDFDRFKGGLHRVAVMSGTRREKRAALSARADVVVTNYETVVSMEAELHALLRRYGGRAILVVDESFLAKNREAARTRALRRLREECGRAFVLCGTPAPNSAHDVVEQFNLVDFGMTFDGVVVPEDRELAGTVIRDAMLDRGMFVRNLKRDVLPDLPARAFTRVMVPFEPKQRQAYEAALDDLILDLSATSEEEFGRRLASFLARRSALLQICSCPAAVIPGYDELPAKLKSLDEILSEYVDRRGEKVVIWSFYRASIDAIMERYTRYRPVRYDGSVSAVAERRDAVRRFQEDDETMIFVGNPAAAGAGLTLHRARLSVYESISNQAAHYLQSLDRIHRRGQQREVEYLILVCEGSIEVQEHNGIARKEQASRYLLGDGTTPRATRAVFLAQAEELRALLAERV